MLAALHGIIMALLRGTIWVRRPPNTPVFTREAVSGLPSELYERIAAFLSKQDLRNFVLTCRALHDAGAVVLYHALDIRENDARTRLSSLLIRLQIHCATHVRFPPILFVRKLKFTGVNPVEDLRILPLLCDVLLHARGIRYLHIDIHPRSSRQFVSLLKRVGVARISTSGAVGAFDLPLGKSAVCPLTLPRLEVLRGSCYDVLTAIGAFRNLRSLIIDGVPSRYELVHLFEQLSSASIGNSLAAITCAVSCNDVLGFIRCVTEIFPRVRYVNMVVMALPPYDQAHTMLMMEVRRSQYHRRAC